MKYRDNVTIIVHPAPGKQKPLMAYIAGTTRDTVPDGIGYTVVEAIEDLFSSRQAGKVCLELERLLPPREDA